MGEAELSSSGSGTNLEVQPLVPQDKPQTQPAELASLDPGGPQPAVPRGSVPGGRRQGQGKGKSPLPFWRERIQPFTPRCYKMLFFCVKARRHLRVAGELKASLLHTHSGFTQYSPPLGFYPRDSRGQADVIAISQMGTLGPMGSDLATVVQDRMSEPSQASSQLTSTLLPQPPLSRARLLSLLPPP